MKLQIYEHKSTNSSTCVVIMHCLRPESDGRGWLRGTARQPSLPLRQQPVTTPTMANLPEAAAAAAALGPAAEAGAAVAADTTTTEPAAAVPAGSPPDPLMSVHRLRYAIPVNLFTANLSTISNTIPAPNEPVPSPDLRKLRNQCKKKETTLT